MNPSKPTVAHIRAPSGRQLGYLFGAVYPAILEGLKRIAHEAADGPCPVSSVKGVHTLMAFVVLEAHDSEATAFTFEDLDRQGVSDFIDAVCAWAAQRGIEVPEPITT